jgi:predicted phosphodiesterase
MLIALVSDTHFDSNDQLLATNWLAVERWLKALSPDLVIHLGDITAKGAANAAELTHAHVLLNRSGFAIRAIPGNHDIGDCPVAAGVEPAEPLDHDRLTDYQRLFGADRWLVEAEGWRLIGLNASVFATGSSEEEAQFEWLAQALDQARGPVGLFLHKPLFRDSPHEDIAHYRYVAKTARLRLLSLLAGHDLRFVAAGHTHQVRHHRVAGTDYLWVPSTAFTVPDFRQEWIGQKRVGVMTLNLAADAYEFAHIIPEGMTAYSLMDFPHIYAEIAELRRRQGYAD